MIMLGLYNWILGKCSVVRNDVCEFKFDFKIIYMIF